LDRKVSEVSDVSEVSEVSDVFGFKARVPRLLLNFRNLRNLVLQTSPRWHQHQFFYSRVFRQNDGVEHGLGNGVG
jgi:hypothetical protein